MWTNCAPVMKESPRTTPTLRSLSPTTLRRPPGGLEETYVGQPAFDRDRPRSFGGGNRFGPRDRFGPGAGFGPRDRFGPPGPPADWSSSDDVSVAMATATMEIRINVKIVHLTRRIAAFDN